MKKEGIIKALCFIDSVYQPRFKYPSDDSTADKMIEGAWFEFLKPYEEKMVMRKIKEAMLIDPEWPPTAPQVAMLIEQELQPKEPAPFEAWRIALKAINKQIKPEDVPENVKKAINFIGESVIAYSKTSDTFIMHDFIKAYKEIIARNKTRRFNEISSGNIKQIEEKK